MSNRWSTGLCGCFSDVKSCCLTFWCPCIAFGRIAEIADEGASSCGSYCIVYTLFATLSQLGVCCLSCLYRAKIRKQYSLERSPCTDCLVHCFCGHCALCQEYRELQNRGFNMSAGWEGNSVARNREVGMAPVVEGGMSRK